jgi:YHS domain-containing protein
MGGLFSLIVFALLFYFMMRFGCGAHMTHGHHSHTDNAQDQQELFDPINGEQVEENEGYGKLHNGKLYRFTSKENLNEFDKNPDKFINKTLGDQHET